MPEGSPGTSPVFAAAESPRDRRRGPVGRSRVGWPRSRRRCSPRSTQLHAVAAVAPRMSISRGAGKDDLPAVGGGHQPGAAIDRQARVAGVVDDHRLVGVQPDPRPQRGGGAPWLCRQRLLERCRGAERHRAPSRTRRPCRRPSARTRDRGWPRSSSRVARRGGPSPPSSPRDPAPRGAWTLRGR